MFQKAQDVLGYGVNTLAPMAQYESLAGAGLQDVGAGIGRTIRAGDLAGYALQADLRPATGSIEAAQFAAMQATPSDFRTSANILGGGMQGAADATSFARQAGEAANQQFGQAGGSIGAAQMAAVRATPSDFTTSARILGGGMQGAAGATGTAINAAQQAAQQYGAASGVLGAGIGSLLGAAQSYDPRAAQSFMNPYQQEVTQQALKEMRRQADIARQGQAAQAVGAGAFGGTREGVQRAEFERNVQDQMQQRIMQDYAQNYMQAQQAAMQGFESQQGRQLAGGQALGQAGMQFANLGQGIGGLTAQQAGIDLSKAQALGALGGQMGGLGVQYGALGEATQQLGSADVGMLAGLGGLERQVEQSQLDAIRGTQMQELMDPYQRLGFVSDIYRGAPTTQMAMTAQTAPSASPLQTAAGLGIGALSAVGGAQRAGLL
jgi:hypothetical protein